MKPLRHQDLFVALAVDVVQTQNARAEGRVPAAHDFVVLELEWPSPYDFASCESCQAALADKTALMSVGSARGLSWIAEGGVGASPFHELALRDRAEMICDYLVRYTQERWSVDEHLWTKRDVVHWAHCVWRYADIRFMDSGDHRAETHFLYLRARELGLDPPPQMPRATTGYVEPKLTTSEDE